MNNYQFLALLHSQFLVYIIILCFTGILYYLLLKKYIYTLLDPILLSFITSLFCSSIVIFLFLFDKINLFVFLSFVTSQLAYFCGLFFFNPQSIIEIQNNTKRVPLKIKNELLFLELFFIVCSIVFILCQLYVYKEKGIPLLMKSRLATFNGGSGFGIFNRILQISNLICLYLLFYFLFIQKKTKIKGYIYLILGFITITFILGGSKSGILNIGYVFTIFLVYNSIYSKKINIYYEYKKREKSLVLFFVVIAIFVISIQNIGNLKSSIFLFIYRFVDSGSVFWYSYPNQVYEIIDNSKPFQALFSDILGLTRIVPWDEQSTNAGFLLIRHHHPELANVAIGPNMRHNIFGLIYFGFVGAILFSFILGVLISFIRNKLISYLPANFIGGIIYLLLYVHIINIETDPMVTISTLNSVVIVFPLLFTVSLALYFVVFNFIKDRISES